MSRGKLIKMVQVPAGKWSLLMSKGKGHLIKIGPFEEWVPQRVVELAADGTLYMSAAYLTPGRVWTSVLRSYPTVKRPAAEVQYGESATDGSREGDMVELAIDFSDDED
ncbi:MAG: hypothetical protein GEEBNDBF_00233 [bacterium]|nr:hypothetical protein [bacterium]